MLKIKENWHGYSINFLCQKDERFTYQVKIADETFDYFTGLGWVEPNKAWPNGPKKRKAPKIEDVLESLTLDADCGNYSFTEFCDNLGYSNDSIKAFETYRACEENAAKIRRLIQQGYLVRVEEQEL